MPIVPKPTPKGNRCDADTLAAWRAVLPGVPDDQIVLPRYHARHYIFPAPNDDGEDRPETQWLVPWLIGQTVDVSLRPAERSQFAASVKGTTGRAWRRAAAWWDSLGRITPLKLNQSLFTRRDKWKDICHHTELMFCLALCCTWLDLPKRRRTAKAAKKIVGELYRQKLRCWERGEIEPGVPDTRWDEWEARRNEPVKTIRIDPEKFRRVVEETAAKLPPEKREAYYLQISEGLNRAEAANQNYEKWKRDQSA